MRILVTLCAWLVTLFCTAQTQPQLPYSEKVSIREAINLSSAYGDKLFAGFNAAPFAVVLVTDSVEFLLNHPNPSKDFSWLGYDTVVKSNVYYRNRQFNKSLLATFPAVSGLSCIVIGTQQNTRKNASEWMVTLLHEHFHQYQASQPGYNPGIDSLDLKNGDQTGMWMLNYPFPYDSATVIRLFAGYSQALLQALKAENENEFRTRVKAYYTARDLFTGALGTKDERYLSLQLWQEGLARHTEYALLRTSKSY